MNKNLIVKLITGGILLGVVVLPMVCLANELSAKIDSWATIITNIGFALVTLMVVVAGILFVTSSGEPGKVTTAKACLLWAVIGGIILAAAVIIQGLVVGS